MITAQHSYEIAAQYMFMSKKKKKYGINDIIMCN